MKYKKLKIKNNGEQLLMEILIAVAVMSVIVGLGSQMIFVSMRSSKVSNERNVALGLAEEMYEAVNGISLERWRDIYGATKGDSNHHYPQQSSGKWVLANGDETVNLNGLDYTRYFTIDNASRDVVTRNIETTYNSANDDPSTQKITVFVSWSGEIISYSQFLSRWRNKVTCQTGWGGSGNPQCPTTSYDVQGTTDIDFGTPGVLKVGMQ